MRHFYQRIKHIIKYFTVLDIGILKLCLFTIGVLAGVYFFNFFDSIRLVLWILFLLSWLYIIVKVFGFYWDKQN